MYSKDLVDSAMRSLNADAEIAKADLARPVLHFRPMAGWMNDINGPLYYKGFYHIFYQIHPFSADWGDGNNMMWGHARSKDLVHWDDLPIAVWPASELGETSCWSGTSCISANGKPMIFYTKCGPDRQKDPYEQWAMIACDDELIKWKKHQSNPIMTLETHGQPEFSQDWRDPFIFSANSRTFMIMGCSSPEGTPIYEAQDKDFTSWAFKGFMAPMNAECPNFVKLGDKWIFLSSVESWTPDCFDPKAEGVKYYIGSFDIDALVFEPESSGMIDLHRGSEGFYGSNVVFDDKGRCILLGRTQGFKGDKGWQGCMALPRILTLNSDIQLIQTPIPELQKLRGKQIHKENLLIDNESIAIEGIDSNTLEILIRFDKVKVASCGLRLFYGDDQDQVFDIGYDGKCLEVDVTKYDIQHFGNNKEFQIHIFIDRSLLEIFVDDGREYISQVLEFGVGDLKLELFAEQGVAEINSLDVWELTE